MNKIFLSLAMFLCGGMVGFLLSSTICQHGERSTALASIYATGEALRSGDLVSAMLYAGSSINAAPDAYDGYQMMAEVYVRQGYIVGARKMYEMSLEKLSAGKEMAMLTEAGVTSVDTAKELLQKKIKEVGLPY